ncbi:aminotransferase class V-fold PLP-dependent enzyme [Sinanaerobacter chloroacetimidivorans]|uniref:cysteine desulfurase n=1 Tax=Sinanaerobacter chloroacetimidivorans TaxID=2818044 RepID=A0A8J8B0I5_9FIRM|nr:aminotransferase class V-fold PLP-dependent enzyme [Sinanaerobacter chloroacetimidivorans]MBR0596666.1 aminotransferase class V-fold PLP-dependent enzyme [Sinanaerobacter chloroacetimidivorans]
MIYLDNAATSWPKPEMVYRKVDQVLREQGGNSGRGSHKMSLAAGELIYEARMLASRLFHAESPETISFTYNATEALNLAIKGTLKPGDHVITSSMEHNSVSRPLHKLENNGIRTSKVLTSGERGLDLNALEAAFEKNTKLVVCSHISNVTGTLHPVKEIGELCRKRGVLFLLDAAQSAGMKEINVGEMKIDLLAFPGHKGLFGPQGTGGLYIREGLILDTLKEGGTGSDSEALFQPGKGPQRYESGTLNHSGIAGLAEGIKYVLSEGITAIEKKETALVNRLITGLQKIDGITVYGPKAGQARGSAVAFTIENTDLEAVSLIIDQSFDVAVRAGLQCAGDTHKTLGTIEKGGVIRISPGYFNTEQEIDICIDAIQRIVHGR